MAERFCVDDIKKRTGISDAQLDRRLEKDKLWELAGVLGSYEEYAGTPGFDLSRTDIADLNARPESISHQHVMVEAFKKWLDMPRADVVTYRSLIEMLIKLRKVRIAEEVCRTGELLAKLINCDSVTCI